MHAHSTYCWCQRMYDTGFTGVPTLDARLRLHYEHWTDESAFRRCFDHFATGEPFTGGYGKTFRGCPVAEDGRVCRDHPSDWIVKVRHWIEQHCPATIHYPALLQEAMYAGRDQTTIDEKDDKIAEQYEDSLALECALASQTRVRRDFREAEASHHDVLERQRLWQLVDERKEEREWAARSGECISRQMTVEENVTYRLGTPTHRPRFKAREHLARIGLADLLRELRQIDNPDVVTWVRRNVESTGYARTFERAASRYQGVAT